ncbi:Saposin [Hexamita inflata]|uniref:Saposin n=1 Tax=Hexamita inflata TaxID=28002 RepID=A0ABP1GFH0_9EUKA
MLFIFTQLLAQDSLQCRACKSGMQAIYDLLDSGAGKDLIELGLQEVCEMYPEGEWKTECQAFVAREYETIIAMLEGQFPVETLCTLMTACEYPIPPINGVCDVCLIGFTFLEDLFSLDLGLDLMEYVLDYVCYIFPEGKWREECIIFINQEYEHLIKFLDNQFPPEYACAALEACDSPFTPVDGACLSCEGAFTFLYDIFEFDSETGLQVIETALDYICYLFPEGSQRDTCDKFINQEYEELVHYISNEFSPKAICLLINACEGPDPEYRTECEFCRIFYQMALDLIEFDATVETIEELLEHICDIFNTPKTQNVCTVFIDKNYEKLLESLIQKYPTEVACEAFGACIA